MVKFFGVQELIEVLRTIGVEQFLSSLIRYTREDFLRWQEFEKSARLASHSDNGVIELMPTSDGELYSFKYVNGHPVNTQFRKLTVTAFGVSRRRSFRLSVAAQRDDDLDGAAYGGHFGTCGKLPGASRK